MAAPVARKMPSVAPEPRLQLTYELLRDRGVFAFSAAQWEAFFRLSPRERKGGEGGLLGEREREEKEK